MADPQSALIQSWQLNAHSWIEAIRTGAIASRQQVTDQAILLAILGRQPERLLDLGCGEGWLLRELDKRGVQAVGVDGDATLVEAARSRAAHGCIWPATKRWWTARWISAGTTT